MTACRCPICHGETHEIRAKLVCRQCGAILETCCEGGPMASGPGDADGGAAPPSPPSRSEERRDH